MKTLIFCLCLIIVCLPFGGNVATPPKNQSVNPLLGDISFIKKFGYLPGASASEDLRIKTHLEFVEDLLRRKSLFGLTPELQQKRARLLDLLRQYRLEGVFPHNYDYQEQRLPCFIDKNNRICAVGYLVEKTAGRQVAEYINARHKYEQILVMNDNKIDAWILQSGLSKEECAMIQPTYGFEHPEEPITRGYGISSSILGGLNISLGIINGSQLARGANRKGVAVAGMLSGATQAILGIAKFPKTSTSLYGTSINGGKRTLSIVNIGLGTSTMLLSAWNLITNTNKKDKKMAWDINRFDTPANTVGMAVTLKRSF